MKRDICKILKMFSLSGIALTMCAVMPSTVSAEDLSADNMQSHPEEMQVTRDGYPLIPIPELRDGYPRMVAPDCRERIAALLETPAGADAMDRLVARMLPYAERHVEEPEWIVGRLQMYWDSHATDVFVKGEKLDHVSGHAPVPTVRFTASRATQTPYRRPALKDRPMYQDSLGIWMQNMSKDGHPYEWADPRETGRNIESMNIEIMNLARDAAFLWWWTGDDRYAEFAADIFDVYMTGLYYRNVPVDMNHGHQQTLIGLTSFEVIHEDIAVPAAECYDFIHDYLAGTRPDKIRIYDDAFRKWADNIIAGGVPHNNWNLIQARFVLYMAIVLGDDKDYPDGKGRRHYLNEILNESSIRQWSPAKLIDYGFDAQTSIWKESPGYAVMVVSEWTDFIRLLDTVLDVDMAALFPVLADAVRTLPQYLFPNGLITGWGDTFYGKLNTSAIKGMIANAMHHGKEDELEEFSSMYRCFCPEAWSAPSEQRIPDKVSSFTTVSPADLDPDTVPGRIEDYVTPTFWSEGVSWFVARTGMDADSSLMMSVCGSEGNHMHANGISMELYGKGYVMAPDLGRGSGYTTLDYTEFYSQFPAHNTVCVDGISSYPVMQSYHPVSLLGCWPQPEDTSDVYKGVLYGDFSFVEPETFSDQRRQILIIDTDPGNGYYVDVFRSRRQDGQDRMHDYFYHNIGQEFILDVPLEPTEELSFAGAHIYAYSYLWDKYSAETSGDVSGRFVMTLPDSTSAGMNMWMKGSPDRKVFKALSPKIYALTRTPMPYDMESPCQTFVARQYGEAWSRPFVAVYEPYVSSCPDGKGGSMIDRVEYPEISGDTRAEVVKVVRKDGRMDYVIAADSLSKVSCDGISCEAVIAVVSDGQIFMSRGLSLSANGMSVTAQSPASAAVKVHEDGSWECWSDAPCKVSVNGRKYRLGAGHHTSSGI